MPQTTRAHGRGNHKPNGKSTEPVAIALARRAGEAAAAEVARKAKRPEKTAPSAPTAPSARRAAKAPKTAPKKAPRAAVTSDEQQLAALLEARLRQLGLVRARVTAVAGAAGADLRFEGIPAAQIDVLKKAIGR